MNENVSLIPCLSLDICRKYSYTAHSPIVFIQSESSNSSSSLLKLFPKDLQSSLGITNINVNPAAPTLLLKLLNKVQGLEASQVLNKVFFMPYVNDVYEFSYDLSHFRNSEVRST